MQKITFTNLKQLTLVGNLYSINATTIIILVHGFLSDKFSKGRFPLYAQAFNQLGYDVLTFDFSGCGESEDEYISMQTEVADLLCAIDYVKKKNYIQIALMGHSLGSLICLQACTTDIKTLVLTGACTGPVNYDWNQFFTPEQMQELDKKGFITEFRLEGERKQILISKQMLLGFSQIEQAKLLKNITCHVLIIHGDNDDEEIQLYHISKQAMQYLSKDSRLEVVHGASHSFLSHVDKVIELASQWFKTQLPLA